MKTLFLAATAALALASTAQAKDNPNQFALHCTGTVTSNGVDKPYDQTWSFDLDKHQYDYVRKNGSVSPLVAPVIDTPTKLVMGLGPGYEEEIQIDRQLGQSYGRGSNGISVAQCEKVPYVPFTQANKF